MRNRRGGGGGSGGRVSGGFRGPTGRPAGGGRRASAGGSGAEAEGRAAEAGRARRAAVGGPERSRAPEPGSGGAVPTAWSASPAVTGKEGVSLKWNGHGDQGRCGRQEERPELRPVTPSVGRGLQETKTFPRRSGAGQPSHRV